jgi:hypothetical protein
VSPIHRSVIAAAVILCTAACTDRSDDSADVGTAADDAAATAPAGAASPESDAPAVFSEADLDAYERGMTAEIAALHAARAASDTASTAEIRAALMQVQWGDGTIAEGARAAGLDESRYRDIRRTVHETLKMLDFQGKIDGPMSYDTSRADDAMRARLARDPIADLPAASAVALRARLDRLAAQWGEYVEMTAVAG